MIKNFNQFKELTPMFNQAEILISENSKSNIEFIKGFIGFKVWSKNPETNKKNYKTCKRT